MRGWLIVLGCLLGGGIGCSSIVPSDDAAVDYHVHYFSPEVIDAIEAKGFDFTSAGYQYSTETPDVHEVSRILRNNPGLLVLLSGGFNFDPSMGAPAYETAVRRENDRLARAVQANPRRLRGFCGIDPFQEIAIAEADRCIADLGLHGIKLHLPISGFDPRDPLYLARLRLFLGSVSRHGVPVLIHNATDPLPGDAYARVLIDSVLDEIGPMTIIFAHLGGPSAWGAFTADFLVTLGGYLDSGADRHQIYFELSALLAEDRIGSEVPIERLEELIGEIGPERILFGSDYPMRDGPRYLEEIEDVLGLDRETLDRILRRDIVSGH